MLWCTWALPWQPQARLAQLQPSTWTWVWSEWAQPAGGGPSDPLRLIGSGVWGLTGCQSLDWSGDVLVRYNGGFWGQRNIEITYFTFCQNNVNYSWHYSTITAYFTIIQAGLFIIYQPHWLIFVFLFKRVATTVFQLLKLKILCRLYLA